MKVNELTIGSWVLGKYDNEPYQIKGISKTEDYIVAKVFEHGMWQKVDVFEPIPLTPEILEKNGFRVEHNIGFYALIGIDDRVQLQNDKEYMNSNNEWYVHIDSEDYCTIANCELTYVHELQNLLRLCKINKEILV